MDKYPDILQTLDKGLQVISYLAQINQSITVGELAGEMKFNKPTTFRILKTLQKRGFVYQYDDGSYGLRVEEFQMIVDKFDSSISLQRIAKPELDRLSRLCNETVTLSSLVGDKAQCLDKVESDAPVHVTHLVGRFSPLYAAATGKAMLAFLPKKELFDYITETPLEAFTHSTVTSKETLNNELLESRRRGYAISHGELDLGVSAVASPIFNKDANVVGAVSILGITERISMENIEKYGELVVEAGLLISKKLNYNGTIHLKERSYT
ncbi:IclR family transcriptional regulator [Bacillus sp. REN16]|uniref:IclR family transcriptional regulator n=1 Tax=Bacillus sp. REN16 TaxID=2887296 RepID=UPI001E4F40D0|nr:IclR family transcriptional regulator [Bacillus sp. REN16]MCC3359162.1 IclR family transcriptional regulator [Bacillus sp. REN16]